jgi:hypothetical protein
MYKTVGIIKLSLPSSGNYIIAFVYQYRRTDGDRLSAPRIFDKRSHLGTKLKRILNAF